MKALVIQLEEGVISFTEFAMRLQAEHNWDIRTIKPLDGKLELDLVQPTNEKNEWGFPKLIDKKVVVTTVTFL